MWVLQDWKAKGNHSLTCREFRFMTAFSLPHKANLLRNYLIYNFFKSEQSELGKFLLLLTVGK